MITTKDVMKAVVRKLDEDYPDINVESEDVDENLKKPCFHVQMRCSRDGSPWFVHDYGTITVFYFPKNEHDCEIEMLDMKNKLTDTFYLVLKVNDDFIVHINELDFDESSNVLILTFEFEMWQTVEEEGELVEELEME